MITTVTGENQIIVPPEIVKDLQIGPGTQISWHKSGTAAVTFEVVQDRAALVRKLSGRGRRYLKPGSKPIEDLIAERSAEG